MKELWIVDLGVAKYVPKSIGQRGFDLQQRTKTDFVDLFESVPIYIRKILNFQLPDEILIGLRKVHLFECSIGIDMKLLDNEFGLDDFFCQILIDEFIIDETLDNKFLPLSFRGFDVDQWAHFIDMVLHRLLIFKRIEMNIELVAIEFLDMFELIIEKLNKDLRICDDIRIPNFWADNEPIE